MTRLISQATLAARGKDRLCAVASPMVTERAVRGRRVLRILVVSPLASHQPTGGAKRRIYNLLWHLKRQGHEIHFIYTCHEAVDHEGAARQMAMDWDSVHVVPFTGTYEKSLGEDFGVDDWIEAGSGDRVRQICDEVSPDIAIIQYVFQTYYCDFIPDHIPTVVDAHDKLSRRHIFEEAGIEPGFFYTTEEDELRGLSRADVILSIQDGEADYFARTGRPVVVVGHICKPEFANRRFNSLSKIGLVAAYNKFNIHSIDRVLPTVLERLDAMGANCDIHIAGNVVHGIGVEHPKLIKRGFVDSVAGFYSEMDLILNPTLKGTGLKIKTIEAMAHGMPLISTDIGFDGLKPRTPFHDVSGADEMADRVEEVQRHQFGTLTKLANLSRAVFTEYEHNLRRNLDTVFSPQLVEQVGDPVALAEFIADGTSALGDPEARNYVRLRDITVPKRDYRIGHVVNPVDLGANSDLYIAQPVTFESMRRAKAAATGVVDVELMAVGYPEDAGAMPHDGFNLLPSLERSVLDTGDFEVPRKLPLLGDLIGSGFSGSNVDYLVFTNVDIALTPQFYTRVAEMIDAGHDAIIINRRTISKTHSSVASIGAMYAEYGEDHPGYDCFVIKRELFEQFNLGQVCVGVHMIGRVLLWNLKAFARNLLIETKEHLTFHIGDDVPSKDARLIDYIRHNVGESLGVLRDLERRAGLLSTLRAEGSRKLLTMNFGPGMFKEFSGDRIRPALAGPIMIHAMFRAGSTYLWRKMRRHKHLKTYYEPLHEDLALVQPKAMDMLKKRHKASSFHKLDVDEWLFKEFETIIARDPESRITGYDRAFTYDEFVAPRDDQAMKAYIDGLLFEQDEQTPVLQFNRSSLRQNWFRRHYPDALHVYMQRSARGQWGSYASFVNRGRMGFVRNTVMLAGKCSDEPSFAPLAQLVPLAFSPNTSHMHQIYDAAYSAYSLEELYTIFYYVWLMSSLMGAANADLFMDMERLSVDRIYQLETEFELMCANVVLDLSDARIPTYDPDTLGLSPDAMDEIEARVHGAVVHAGWPLPIERLRALDQHELADKLERAGQQPAPQGAPDIPARKAQIEALLQGELDKIANKSWQPSDHPNPAREKPRAMVPPQGGRTIAFNQILATGGSDMSDLLDDGWHLPGTRRSRASADVATMRLEFEPSHDVSMKLRIAASCENRERAAYSIGMDGTPVYQGEATARFTTIEFPVPDEIAGTPRTHLLEFHCPVEETAVGPVGLVLEALELTRPEPHPSQGEVVQPPVAAGGAVADAAQAKTDMPASQDSASHAAGPKHLVTDVFPVGEHTRPSLLYGWEAPEGGHVWSNSFTAALQFSFQHASPPPWLVIDLATLNELAGDPSMFAIFLNGRLVYQGELWPEVHRVAIKGVDSIMVAGELNEVRFETRQLYKPEEDYRQLGVRLCNLGVTRAIRPPHGVKFEDVGRVEGLEAVAWSLEPRAQPQPDPVPAAPASDAGRAKVVPGQPIGPGDGALNLVSGWSYAEGEHVWAIDRVAQLDFLANGQLRAARSLCLSLMLPEAQRGELQARLNGEPIGNLVASDQFEEHALPLAPEQIRPDSVNTLEIEAVGDFETVCDSAGRSLVFCLKTFRVEPS